MWRLLQMAFPILNVPRFSDTCQMDCFVSAVNDYCQLPVLQAKAPQLHGETRRWNFNEMQNLKKKTVGASLDEEHKPTEIFIMLPLDIIAVGELEEGEGPPHSLPMDSLQ